MRVFATGRRNQDFCDEAYLPTLQDSARPYPWLSCTHEDTRWPRRHQCAAGQGAQTPVGLIARRRSVAVGAILRSADFERVLGARPRARTDHFALHHVPEPVAGELSTSDAPTRHRSVDDLRLSAGIVVPKRHAKRAVTRSLVKRLARLALVRHAAGLSAGRWVVRLRAPFNSQQYCSASSAALRIAVRDELERLFGLALARAVMA